jgi:hypothetical protein
MPEGKGFLGGVAACFIDWVPSAPNRGVYLTTPIATEPAQVGERSSQAESLSLSPGSHVLENALAARLA